MGRPYKRQRFSDPPELALHYRREQNDLRLKSTFETIFEKYGKDFDGVGDEIDLETGEIIVDNGHILSMVNERDAGGLETDSEEEESDDDWPEDERVLASTLLSETRRRMDALGAFRASDDRVCVQEELQSDDEADSLLGSEDSLMGDAEAELSIPARPPNSQSPDSLYDDEEGDKLASREMEWPTPRKASPTPTKATPLGHTPWHSSPAKPVYKCNTLIDPAWRAPPLPDDGEPRQRSKPAALTRHLETEDFQRDRYIRHYPLSISKSRSPLRRKLSLGTSLGGIKSLDSERESGSSANAPLLNIESVRPPRWTKDEERLLRQLRTTKTSMCKEMKPYSPGRRSRAIMIHWSEMTENDRGWDQPATPPKCGTSGPSSRRRLSPRNKFYNSQAGLKWKSSVSHRDVPTHDLAAIGSMESPASNGPDLVPYRAISHPRIKQESVPPRFNLEVPNTSDPTEQSQGTMSSSPAPFARPWAPSISAEPSKSPSNDVREDEQATQVAVTTVSHSDIESACSTDNQLPINANRALHLSRQSSNEASWSRSSKSSSTISCAKRDVSSAPSSIRQAQGPQHYQANALGRVASRSLYPIDGSDDELSAPIKTVGSHKTESRTAPTTTLSDILLDRSSSSASRCS